MTAANECSRCGQCCLASPCFEIPIGKERYKIVDGIRIHVCKHLSFRKKQATCDLIRLGKVKVTGECSSAKRDSYHFNISKIRKRL
jgi:hypothetical protein